MNSEINDKNKSLTLVDGSGFILELITLPPLQTRWHAY